MSRSLEKHVSRLRAHQALRDYVLGAEVPPHKAKPRIKDRL